VPQDRSITYSVVRGATHAIQGENEPCHLVRELGNNLLGPKGYPPTGGRIKSPRLHEKTGMHKRRNSVRKAGAVFVRAGG